MGSKTERRLRGRLFCVGGEALRQRPSYDKKSGNFSVAALVARERLICASLCLMSLYLLTQPKPARKHDTMYRFYFLLTPLQVNLLVTPENKNTELKSGVFVCLVARERLELSTFGL